MLHLLTYYTPSLNVSLVHCECLPTTIVHRNRFQPCAWLWLSQAERALMADDIQPSDGLVPWYIDEPSEISPQAREILEKYSKIPSQEIIPHILQVVSSSFRPSSPANSVLSLAIRASPDIH